MRLGCIQMSEYGGLVSHVREGVALGKGSKKIHLQNVMVMVVAVVRVTIIMEGTQRHVSMPLVD